MKRQPALFIGHGSPMNALAQNQYTKTLSHLGKELGRPKAILMISAHWMTNGTWVTSMKDPKTIHDFFGFPQPLFDVQYPAPGDPGLAERVAACVHSVSIQKDSSEWGLDHGTWSVLKHIYPDADVPVVQLSLDMSLPTQTHYKIGAELSSLRDEGIMILASGNVVHNLRRISWEEKAPAFDWANEFNNWVIEKLNQRDFQSLTESYMDSDAGRLSVPTPDHYLPLLYVLGAARADDRLRLEYDEIQNASISMLTFSFGR